LFVPFSTACQFVDLLNRPTELRGEWPLRRNAETSDVASEPRSLVCSQAMCHSIDDVQFRGPSAPTGDIFGKWIAVYIHRPQSMTSFNPTYWEELRYFHQRVSDRKRLRRRPYKSIHFSVQYYSVLHIEMPAKCNQVVRKNVYSTSNGASIRASEVGCRCSPHECS
jgi:hypothetical protein